MDRANLKSYKFRSERDTIWRELEDLVKFAEKKGLHSLTAKQLFRLPNLYRATLSSLSVARNISLDAGLLAYLEGLSARAYFLVYGAYGRPGATIAEFLRRGLPEAVRRHARLLFLATALFFLGVSVGYVMTSRDPEAFYSFVSADYADGRLPTSSAEDLRQTLFSDDESETESLSVFATYLFTHNAQVGIFAFALGLAFGLPTALLMIYNGAVIGAFWALFAARGLGLEFLGWVSIHGTTEILAVLLCGAAGFVLARGQILPDRSGRLKALAREGRQAARIVIAAVMMFLVAGLLEGFGRQLIQGTGTRLAIAVAMLGLWTVYFGWAGRDRTPENGV